MRITKIRLAKLASMVRNQIVLNDKADELRQRMESGQTRVDKRYRDKLKPEEYDQYLVSRENYNQAYYQKWSELRSTMPCHTIAEKFKIVDKASEWAIEQTGFKRSNI
ncbi:MAG: hypothetical protein G8D81_20495 [gamma proteobacterium symbiont of Clathrolucina costata]